MRSARSHITNLNNSLEKSIEGEDVDTTNKFRDISSLHSHPDTSAPEWGVMQSNINVSKFLIRI
jgi:hypothetical protein